MRRTLLLSTSLGIPLVLGLTIRQETGSDLVLPISSTLTVRGPASQATPSTSEISPFAYQPECGDPAWGDFACVHCNNSILSDETQFAEDRWNAADGDEAWASIKAWWYIVSYSGPDPLRAIQGFVPSISYAFDGPTQWDCQDLGATYCDTVVECGDVNTPAASMILTSFANIHQFYNNMYTGIFNGQEIMETQLAQFAATFAPQNKATISILKIVMDAFGIAFGVIGAAVWNICLKDAAFIEKIGANHGFLKDSANSATACGLALAKDSQNGIQGQVDTLNDINSILGLLLQGWADITQTYVTELFSGSADGLVLLDAFIYGGAWVDASDSTSLYNLTDIMQNVLYAQLIPQTWIDHSEVHPVIIYDPDDTMTNPAQAGPIFNTDKGNAEDPNMLQARTTYNGYSLWLLDAHDCDRRPGSMTTSAGCEGALLQPLPGQQKLTPGNPWGGVLTDDINISTWLGYVINGNQNGYIMPDDSLFTNETENADFPFQAGIRTPGFFGNIPVCTYNDTLHSVSAWRKHKLNQADCPFYPCCRPQLDT
ncbi:hypothetical protein MMC09_006218 [Bachmanniomyces sp. S44760]|nr:hypothetical protein [Bachmanniomyces sp. S44760]